MGPEPQIIIQQISGLEDAVQAGVRRTEATTELVSGVERQFEELARRCGTSTVLFGETVAELEEKIEAAKAILTQNAAVANERRRQVQELALRTPKATSRAQIAARSWQKALLVAEKNLEAAKVGLLQAIAGVEAAEASLNGAQQSLAQAQAALSSCRAESENDEGGGSSSCSGELAAVSAAEATVHEAKAALSQAEATVILAQAALQEASAKLSAVGQRLSVARNLVAVLKEIQVRTEEVDCAIYSATRLLESVGEEAQIGSWHSKKALENSWDASKSAREGTLLVENSIERSAHVASTVKHAKEIVQSMLIETDKKIAILEEYDRSGLNG